MSKSFMMHSKSYDYIVINTICFVTVGRARASFRQSFRFGNMRDRGTRLAGYLTPPSDVTQEEEETASEGRVVVIPCDSNRY